MAKTQAEFEADLLRLFPAEVKGIKRPTEPIQADFDFSTKLPQIISKDPVKFDLMNAIFSQLLSNDEKVKLELAEKIGKNGGILAGKNITLTPNEDGSIRISVEGDLGMNMLKRNTIYAVGDVAYVPSLPTWARLDCITAGVTGGEEPVWSPVTVGKEIIDGTVKWIIRDVKNALYAP